jgi:perosamine synthetase
MNLTAIVDAIRDVAAPGNQRVALHEPRFAGKEWDYVKDCLDTGWVSSVGQYVDRFERDLARTCGTQHAVAVVNGTAALHMAFLAAGVKPGDEILMPTLTFVATANAASHAGAIPHFVDSEETSLGIAPAKLAEYLSQIAQRTDSGVVNTRTGRRIAAIAPMHTFGHPVDMEPLTELARDWGILVVEDATESLGSLYKGKPTGSLAPIATLSFNGNKVVTTGGGGAVLTDDPELARRVKHLTTTAKKPHQWAFLHDEIGFNYRLPNINAALGCAQLEQLDGFLSAKRRLAEAYRERFTSVEGCSFVREPGYARSNFWLNAIMLDDDHVSMRDEVLRLTNEAGLMTRPCWELMHRLPMYCDNPRMDVAGAERIAARLINIPSSAVLADGL